MYLFGMKIDGKHKKIVGNLYESSKCSTFAAHFENRHSTSFFMINL